MPRGGRVPWGVTRIAGICGTLLLVGPGAAFVSPKAQAGAVSPSPEKAGAASALAFAMLILKTLLLASDLTLVRRRAQRQT